MTEVTQTPEELAAAAAAVAQDATAEKPAPEVAADPAAAPDPAAAASEPLPAVVAADDQGEDPLGEPSGPNVPSLSVPHAHRGVQSAPADHPRRVAHLKKHGG